MLNFFFFLAKVYNAWIMLLVYRMIFIKGWKNEKRGRLMDCIIFVKVRIVWDSIACGQILRVLIQWSSPFPRYAGSAILPRLCEEGAGSSSVNGRAAFFEALPDVADNRVQVYTAISGSCIPVKLLLRCRLLEVTACQLLLLMSRRPLQGLMVVVDISINMVNYNATHP